MQLKVVWMQTLAMLRITRASMQTEPAGRPRGQACWMMWG